MKHSQTIFARPTRPPVRRFGRAEELILRALNRYHYLTALQVCRVLSRNGGLGTIRKAQTKLKWLTEAGYLQREMLPTPGFSGRGAYVYSLGTLGRRVLIDLGEEVRPRFRPQESRTHGLLFLPHTVALNDVLLCTELLCRLAPDKVRLDELRHERDLKRSPIKLTLSAESGVEQATVIPDGWVDLALLTRGERRCLLVELDQGTERRVKWQRKVAELMSLVTPDASGVSPYSQFFGRQAVSIVVVTTAGTHRREMLTTWTNSFLTEQGRGEIRDLFFFTELSALDADPQQFFAKRQWYQPGRSERVALLDLDEVGDG